MKGQGTGLWLVAIGLIAVFMVATMVAPGMLNPSPGGTNDGGGNGPEPLTFQPPTVELRSSTVDQDDSTELTVRSTAASSTTGEGGNFVWVLSVQGANGQGNVMQMTYDGEAVQWFGGSNGLLVGVGPRFSQGPGAVPVEVTASFNVTPLMPGKYTIEAWVAEASKVLTLDPIGLKAVSPPRSVDLTVNEKLKPDVSVTQDLSGPSTALEDKVIEFTLDSKGTASGKWSGSLTDRIIISKSKISTSDVLVRVGGTTIRMNDDGDSLTGDLQTVKPFDGGSKTESAEWSVKVQITFLNSGDYRVQGSCADSVSKKMLSTTGDHVIKVSKTGSSSSSTNSTNSSGEATTLPTDSAAKTSPPQPTNTNAPPKNDTPAPTVSPTPAPPATTPTANTTK